MYLRVVSSLWFTTSTLMPHPRALELLTFRSEVMALSAPIQHDHAYKIHKKKSCVGFVLGATETEDGIVGVFFCLPL